MNSWEGRIAFVSVASRGIGAAICKELAQHGMVVIGCARSVELIKAMAEENMYNKWKGELHAMKCDLSSEIEIIAMFKEIRRRFGHIDVCVNNTGFASTSSFTDASTKNFKHLLEVNIMAVSNCTRECLMLMDRNKDGMIIQVVQCGKVVDRQKRSTPTKDSPGYEMYKGVNFATIAFTDALGQELKSEDSKISVKCIRPSAKVIDFLFGITTSPEAARYLIRAKRTEVEVIADHVMKILVEGNEETQTVELLPTDFL